MAKGVDSALDEARRRVAREYRQRGYRVIEPAERSALPEFLRDLKPDLVAMKEGDHVVVEVREARSLKGSNDLTELASRVAQEKGWRLELIAVPAAEDLAAWSPWPERIDGLVEQADRAFELGLTHAGYVYAAAVLEALVLEVAAANSLKVRGQSLPLVSRELVFHGVIPEAKLKLLLGLWRRRNDLVHGGSATPPPSREELKVVLDTCRWLQSVSRLQAAE